MPTTEELNGATYATVHVANFKISEADLKISEALEEIKRLAKAEVHKDIFTIAPVSAEHYRTIEAAAATIEAVAAKAAERLETLTASTN